MSCITPTTVTKPSMKSRTIKEHTRKIIKLTNASKTQESTYPKTSVMRHVSKEHQQSFHTTITENKDRVMIELVINYMENHEVVKTKRFLHVDNK
jgi:hypothetical protein